VIRASWIFLAFVALAFLAAVAFLEPIDLDEGDVKARAVYDMPGDR